MDIFHRLKVKKKVNAILSRYDKIYDMWEECGDETAKNLLYLELVDLAVAFDVLVDKDVKVDKIPALTIKHINSKLLNENNTSYTFKLLEGESDKFRRRYRKQSRGSKLGKRLSMFYFKNRLHLSSLETDLLVNELKELDLDESIRETFLGSSSELRAYIKEVYKYNKFKWKPVARFKHLELPPSPPPARKLSS